MRSELSKRTTRVYSKHGSNTAAKGAGASNQAVWYKIPYPASSYTFPGETLIRCARFDKIRMHIELEDGRVLSIPLKWVPSVFNATPQEREKYEISRDRTMIIWDPDKCAINDELRIADYLSATGAANVFKVGKTPERRRAPAPRRRPRALSAKARG